MQTRLNEKKRRYRLVRRRAIDKAQDVIDTLKPFSGRGGWLTDLDKAQRYNYLKAESWLAWAKTNNKFIKEYDKDETKLSKGEKGRLFKGYDVYKYNPRGYEYTGRQKKAPKYKKTRVKKPPLDIKRPDGPKLRAGGGGKGLSIPRYDSWDDYYDQPGLFDRRDKIIIVGGAKYILSGGSYKLAASERAKPPRISPDEPPPLRHTVLPQISDITGKGSLLPYAKTLADVPNTANNHPYKKKDVLKVQRALVKAGYLEETDIDGIWGDTTSGALRSYQYRASLKLDTFKGRLDQYAQRATNDTFEAIDAGVFKTKSKFLKYALLPHAVDSGRRQGDAVYKYHQMKYVKMMKDDGEQVPQKYIAELNKYIRKVRGQIGPGQPVVPVEPPLAVAGADVEEPAGVEAPGDIPAETEPAKPKKSKKRVRRRRKKAYQTKIRKRKINPKGNFAQGVGLT